MGYQHNYNFHSREIFTKAELNEKKHDVNFIVKQARSVIRDKRIDGLCTNNVPTDYGQLYTTHEASTIIDKIVGDSVYYSNRLY